MKTCQSLGTTGGRRAVQNDMGGVEKKIEASCTASMYCTHSMYCKTPASIAQAHGPSVVWHIQEEQLKDGAVAEPVAVVRKGSEPKGRMCSRPLLLAVSVWNPLRLVVGCNLSFPPSFLPSSPPSFFLKEEPERGPPRQGTRTGSPSSRDQEGVPLVKGPERSPPRQGTRTGFPSSRDQKGVRWTSLPRQYIEGDPHHVQEQLPSTGPTCHGCRMAGSHPGVALRDRCTS